MDIYELSFKEFAEYVKKIEYGYIDKNNIIHKDEFTNPVNDYHLQKTEETIKNNIGLCFDIVEMYRSYLRRKNLHCESYYLEYSDKDILESHAFMIEKKPNNLWYECIDNSWVNDFKQKGFKDKDLLIKSIYEWFQNYVEKEYKNVNKTKFYMNKYSEPIPVFNNESSLRDFCAKRDYLTTHRTEFSGMAIVFCKGKVLVLETRHNEYVFPKGHIESGENSKDASIRECFEESGISITNGKYFGKCGEYSYTFSAGHLKICNDDYFKTFGVNSITKNIYVHVFEINDFQQFNLESIFIKGVWVDIDKINSTITHDNTREVFKKALDLYNGKNKVSL